MAVKVVRNKTATGKRITTRMIDSPMFLGDNRCFRFWIFIFYYSLIRFVVFQTGSRGNGRKIAPSLWWYRCMINKIVHIISLFLRKNLLS